jgi:DNA-binding transcriptional LysR family regulator
VYNSGRDHVMQMLCDGLTHISVVSSLVNCRDAEFKPFFSDRVVLIVPVDHPWASRDSIAPQQLRDAVFVSWLVAQRGVQLGRIKIVEIEGLNLERKIYMAYHIRRAATSAQAEFWNFVHKPVNETLLKLAA